MNVPLRQAIAIDLGGTQVRVGVVAEDGSLGFRHSLPTLAQSGPKAVLDQIAALVAAARTAAPAALARIGVAAPGPLDTRAGVVRTMQSLAGFSDFPLRQALQDRLDAPVALENDGIAAAIGEWRFGAGRGVADLLYLTLSTGIGGGIIAGGRPLRGRNGLAGHVGHIFFSAPWDRAPGGRMTCFEDYASGTALARRARAEAPDGSALAGGQPDAAAVFAAAAAGDAFARTLVADEAQALGLGLASLVHVLDPELVLLGGGLAAALPALMPGLLATLQSHAKPGFQAVEVRPAGLGAQSGLCGAAALVFDPTLDPAGGSAD